MLLANGKHTLRIFAVRRGHGWSGGWELHCCVTDRQIKRVELRTVHGIEREAARSALRPALDSLAMHDPDGALEQMGRLALQDVAVVH